MRCCNSCRPSDSTCRTYSNSLALRTARKPQRSPLTSKPKRKPLAKKNSDQERLSGNFNGVLACYPAARFSIEGDSNETYEGAWPHPARFVSARRQRECAGSNNASGGETGANRNER